VYCLGQAMLLPKVTELGYSQAADPSTKWTTKSRALQKYDKSASDCTFYITQAKTSKIWRQDIHKRIFKNEIL